jgi:hypothetical protein
MSEADDAGRTLEQKVMSAQRRPGGQGKGPPPLTSFDLMLRHDGSWTHEGVPFRNVRLREKFDRSVRYLPEEKAHVVQIGRFRGLIDVEEAGFFVRGFDPERGTIHLSDGSEESLDVDSLRPSDRDGALLCQVKCELTPGGLLARFSHAAQAEFMNAVSEDGESVILGGDEIALPEI